MPSIWLFELPAVLLGLLLGSFLNVCISRLPRGRSVVKPRSRCESCGETIRWYENVPVVSWLVLRGRCRRCGAGIRWRYPAVEIGTALWFWFVVQQEVKFGAAATLTSPSGYSLEAGIIRVAILLAIGFLLIGLMVMDWETQRLPDAFTLTGSVTGFVLTCCKALFLGPGQGDVHFDPQAQMRMSSPGSFAAKGDVFLTGPEALVLGRMAAILAAAGLMFAIRVFYRKLRHREGIGLGDVKLMGMLAAFLGFWPSIFCLLVGSVLASLYSLPLVIAGKAKGSTKLPFGSFLCAAGLLVALFGEPLMSWYLSLLR